MQRLQKMKLLIYAHYYVPDTASTGQILCELAEGLLETFDVTVICVVPSYLGTIEGKYMTQKYYHENINGVKVIRIRVPEFSKNNKISRIKNILAYFGGAISATSKIEKTDYILSVSQPPILGGLIGVYAKFKIRTRYRNDNVKFIYQIQDVNPEQIEAVGYFRFKLLLWLLRKLDTFSCKQADLVITVGRDLVETVKKRFKKDILYRRHSTKMPPIVLINNWIDEKRIYPLSSYHKKVVAFKKQYGLTNKFIICYSGNLGHYYDLMNLLKIVEKFKPGIRTPNGKDVVFTFIGSGSLLNTMKQYVHDHHMTNVIFIPYQDKGNLNFSLNAGDVHWCVNASGIKGVSCPSKYYGIASVGKPVLAVLEKGSEIYEIINEIQGGLLAEPGDCETIEKNLKWFIEHDGHTEMQQMGIRSRKYLVENFTRDKSISKYTEEILNLKNQKGSNAFYMRS